MNALLIWFRRDLRLDDNPTLSWARQQGCPVIPVYIDGREQEGRWAPGGASRWWLHHSLQALAGQLSAEGLRLHLFQGEATDILPRLAKEAGVTTVLCNTLEEPHLRRRDRAVAQALSAIDAELRIFDTDHLVRPGDLRNQQGNPYRVFTPFWKQVRRRLHRSAATPSPAARRPLNGTGHRFRDSITLDQLGLLDSHPWHTRLHRYWQPGEVTARQRLEAFIDRALGDYPVDRDLPGVDGTSGLSPHLHFGELSPLQVWHRLQPLLDGPAKVAAGAESWLRQLGWGEFSRYILWHFPETAERPLDARFSDDFWCMDEELFHAWRRGRTGIAIIDAGMHQLWESGWMHNRVRMLVASFLTKNLGIPWQAGARWFWDTLVDADLANNSMGWQWVAGCGVDAAPYFRIFNPQTQAERYDADGNYCRRWLSGRERVRPAKPLVDPGHSRAVALDRYGRLIRKSKAV